MRRVRFDFVAQASVSRTTGWALLAVSVFAAGAVAYAYHDKVETAGAWEVEWQRLQRVSRPGLPKVGNSETLEAEIKDARKVIDRLSWPWQKFFEAIEASTDERVTLLTVEPDPEKREVRLTAEAKDFAAMFDYVRKLQQSEVLGDCHVAGYQIQDKDPQRPVRFVLLVQSLFASRR